VLRILEQDLLEVKIDILEDVVRQSPFPDLLRDHTGEPYTMALGKS